MQVSKSCSLTHIFSLAVFFFLLNILVTPAQALPDSESDDPLKQLACANDVKPLEGEKEDPHNTALVIRRRLERRGDNDGIKSIETLRTALLGAKPIAIADINTQASLACGEVGLKLLKDVSTRDPKSPDISFMVAGLKGALAKLDKSRQAIKPPTGLQRIYARLTNQVIETFNMDTLAKLLQDYAGQVVLAKNENIHELEYIETELTRVKTLIKELEQKLVAATEAEQEYLDKTYRPSVTLFEQKLIDQFEMNDITTQFRAIQYTVENTASILLRTQISGLTLDEHKKDSYAIDRVYGGILTDLLPMIGHDALLGIINDKKKGRVEFAQDTRLLAGTLLERAASQYGAVAQRAAELDALPSLPHESVMKAVDTICTSFGQNLSALETLDKNRTAHRIALAQGRTKLEKNFLAYTKAIAEAGIKGTMEVTFASTEPGNSNANNPATLNAQMLKHLIENQAPRIQLPPPDGKKPAQ